MGIRFSSGNNGGSVNTAAENAVLAGTARVKRGNFGDQIACLRSSQRFSRGTLA